MHTLPLQAEPVFYLGDLPITNAVLATWVTMVLLIGLAWLVRRGIRTGRGLGATLALVLESIVGLFEDILGWETTRRLLPLLGTFFVFILAANWLGLVPGFGAVALAGDEPIPILRGATTDLHTTLALALISVGTVQSWGLIRQGGRYLKKYLNFSGPLWLAPVNLLVGLLEAISELAKIVSFAFRLFGNIFAGEILLTIMIGLIPLLVPALFYGLELFVGFIQAFVFVLLTTVFLKLAGESHDAEHQG